MKNNQEKQIFSGQLKKFASSLGERIALNDEWTIRGFIDIFKNVYTISSDTKIISKILKSIHSSISVCTCVCKEVNKHFSDNF